MGFSLAPGSSPSLVTPGDALALLRQAPPLVQCLTNTVVQQFTANVLLALGASPAMADNDGEAGPFASIATGVLVNLGTPHREQIEGMHQAVASATHAGTPWVLDPVAVGALPVRTALAHRLVEARPTVIRGNASEVAVVAGTGAGGRGTDSLATPEDVLPGAAALARRTDGTVAVSGPRDLVTDGERAWWVGGGSALLTRVTGGGCALGAVVAAAVGAVLGSDPGSDAARRRSLAARATACAHALYSVAAERAEALSGGPGSFAVALLDQLAALDPADPALGADAATGRIVEAELALSPAEATTHAATHATAERQQEDHP